MRQRQFALIGAEGCYLDCIRFLAEDFTKQYIDLFKVYSKGLEEKILEANCFLNKPEELLSDLTRVDWTLSKEDLTYQCKPHEYEITRYEWKEGSLTHSHFVVTDGAGMVLYDPMGKSATVANGQPVSLRIFRRT